MRAKVLIDNIAREGFIAEWGLSLWLEYGEHRILLDAGTTGRFAENARGMGVDLSRAEVGVLSHAHYDHANGLEAFFALNPAAKVYLRKGAGENCYGKKGWKFHYNGIRRGLLKQYAKRFIYAEGCCEILPGAWLIPHSSEGLEKIAARSGLYVRRGLRLRPDDFSHEQSLVLDTRDGLVIFNSCSHAGPDNIIAEVRRAMPQRPVYALVGGLHLYKLTDGEVRALAARIRATGIRRVFTGHCTGQRAYEVLREELGECVEQLFTGMEIEV